jgi:hypothetical protein
MVYGGWNQLIHMIHVLKLIKVAGAVYMTLQFHPVAVILIIFFNDNSIFNAKASFWKTILNNWM